MLEDESDSESSESEPLVQQSGGGPPSRRDPCAWKQQSGSSGSGKRSNPNRSKEKGKSSTPPNVPPRKKSPVDQGDPSSTTSTPGNTSTAEAVSAPAPGEGEGGVGSQGVGGTSRTSGILTRGSSKRLHDLVSHLELVPEKDELDSSESPTAGCSDNEGVILSKQGGHAETLLKLKEEEEFARIQETCPSHSEEPSSLACPFFGVRNYLHQFYDKPNVKDPTLYEDIFPYPSDEGVFLVKSSGASCSSPVFRLSALLAGLIILMGVIALVVAACSTRRTPVVAKVGGVSVVDRQAAAHNAEVDALVLVGLVALALGCSVLTAALLSRAFCFHVHESRPFRIRVLGGEVTSLPYASEGLVPVTEQLTSVQPPWLGASGYSSVKGVLMVP